MRSLLTLTLTLAVAGVAQASITVDGTVDASYGAPLAVQTVQTQFGDSSGNGAGGGELDAAYAKVWNDRLYVMITGNVEANFNKLHLFIDSKAGGENTLSSGPAYDFGNVSSNFGGLTFDQGFEADYHVFGRWGGGNFEVDVVDRAGGTCGAACGGDFGAGAVGGGAFSVLGNGTGTTSFLNGAAEAAHDDSNSAGVMGGTGAADQVAAAAVTTGFEFSIALADIGSPSVGSQILIHAAYGNGDNNYHSNQVLGGLPAGTGNLGGDGAGVFTGNLGGVDFNNFAGLQYFSVPVTAEIPEPASLVLVGLAAVAATARRRS
ncbi:PEP-CTERM sorting domain-containing protein [Botrimarina hoheduenensis]|uniref:Ice-binding protein C-terminal domain-containing protein n=1 Tax=Botrimarina hoheduenensis TaxID=2528000 RepID=A0A5C5WER6_9BACT|nr:PEP-CTERM sorting domain-containing protein [Botrimarina hoheduenensis]TWT48593.1 hypothetical protein Pla111_03680 [Botrimarina hoheduenensis]